MTHNSTKTKRGNRIFKKTPTSKSWTYMKQVSGRRYYFRLGPVISEAKTLADEIDAYSYLNPIENVVKKYRPNGLRGGEGSRKIPMVKDIEKRFRLFARSECGIEQSTIESYLIGFKKIIKQATGKDPDKFLLSDFTPILISEFKRQRLENVTDHDKRISVKRTINSYMANVRGLFSKKAVKLYKDYDIKEVMETLDDFDPYEKVNKKYRLPDPKIIVRTHELLAHYEKSSSLYIPLALALHFGLRRNELVHTRRSWFEKLGDRYRIAVFTEGKFRVKAGEDGYAFGSSVVAEKILSISNGFDYLIENRSTRSTLEPLLKDLRKIGWDRDKPLHECRKLYGSFWASKEGLYFAQKTLRHSTPLTTNDYYADLIEEESLINLWSA